MNDGNDNDYYLNNNNFSAVCLRGQLYIELNVGLIEQIEHYFVDKIMWSLWCN